MRYRPRLDSTHLEIVEGLRKVGYSARSLASVGQGCPDILCGANGVNYLLEVKVTGGKLTPQEQVFHAAWRGQVAVVHSLEEALAIVSQVRF